MMIIETVTNLYGLLGLGIGSITGVAIAYFKSKTSENKKINRLEDSLDELKTRFDGLKNGFNLVYDEMERRGELPEQLKAFKKMFDL